MAIKITGTFEPTGSFPLAKAKDIDMGDGTRLDQLPEAIPAQVQSALQEAKESGAFKGDPGEQGPQGEKGEKGDKGDKGDPGDGSDIVTDATFTIPGAAADAAAVGAALAEAQGVFEAFGTAINTHTEQIQANAEAVAKAKMPEVTAEDNGKFLRVTDGAWAAVSIEAAEGASF